MSKKNKTYRLKSSSEAAPLSASRVSNQNFATNNPYSDDGRDNEEEQQDIYYQIEFEQKEIFHLFLVELLPGNQTNYSLDLPNSRIVSVKGRSPPKILQKCKDFLQNYSLKVLRRKQVQFNLQTIMKNKFDIRCYDKRKIQEIFQFILKKFKGKSISSVFEQVKSKRIQFFLSVNNDKYQDFIDWYEQTKHTDYPSSLIKQLETQSSTIFNKLDQSDDEQQQSDDLSSKSKKKKYVRKDQVQKQQNNHLQSGPVNTRRNVQDKPIIFHKQYPLSEFDQNDFEHWLRRNKDIRFNDYESQIKGQSIFIILRSFEKCEEKKKALNIYLNHQRIVMIEFQNKKVHETIKNKFEIKTVSLSCTFVSGYKQKTTHAHGLRKNIAINRIDRSNRRDVKFFVFLVVGLKNLVEKKVDEIEQFIREVRKQPQIIQDNLIINLPDIQPYFHHDKVFALIKKVILRQFPKKFDDYKLLDVIKVRTAVCINLEIKFEKNDEYLGLEKKKILHQIEILFKVDQIIGRIQQLPDDLISELIILPFDQDDTKVVLISDSLTFKEQKRKVSDAIEKKRSQDLQTTEIEIKTRKGRFAMIESYISKDLKENKLKCDRVKNIKMYPDHDKQIIRLVGPKKNTIQISQLIKSYINELENCITSRIFELSQNESYVVEKNSEKFKNQMTKNQLAVQFMLNYDVELGALISFGDDKSLNPDDRLVIRVQKIKQLSKLPKKTFICFSSVEQIKSCKETFFLKMHPKLVNKIGYVLSDDEQEYSYVYLDEKTNFKDLVKKALVNYPSSFPCTPKIFSFFMPKINKKEFVSAIISEMAPQLENNQIRVFIFEDFSVNIEKQLSGLTSKFQKSQRKYFLIDENGKRFDYSQEGDQKILKALDKGKTSVILTNSDLKLSHITHSCSLTELKLVHLQSKTETRIEMIGRNVYFEVAGHKIQLPQQQLSKVQKNPNKCEEISVGAYLIDLKNNIQKNLFSGFQRRIQFELINVSAYNLNISFSEKVNQIQIMYNLNKEKQAIKAEQLLKKLIQDERIFEDIQVGINISKNQLDEAIQSGREYNVEVVKKDNQTLTLSSFDKNNISIMQKLLKYIFSPEKTKKKEETFEFPKFWQHQTQDIQLFEVDQNSQQFIEVKSKFTVKKIAKLQRIQNKIVYPKYFQSKKQLEFLNKGKKVKEMMLFHGTRGTDPKLIYEDKEECFNINYTGDNNFLGRGTYFAERSQYSHNYSFKTEKSQSRHSWNIFGGGQSYQQMFYCEVLVGDSQKVTAVTDQSRNMRDTDYKDPVEKIRYESSTTFTNGSTIYTVYKNRRAYPMYLITY